MDGQELEKGFCLACGNELEEVSDGSGKWRMYLGALDLTLLPGYAEKIDGDHPLKFHICDPCGTKLFALFPRLHAALAESANVTQPQARNSAWRFN
jgi:hypothetical protein